MKYHFSLPNQSPWLIDIYNNYIEYKTNGFLVEIGVGHTIGCGSNTADLIDIGWKGIYIDPVFEYCEEAKLRHRNSLDRLIIINSGASDKVEDCILYLGDSFIPNNLNNSIEAKKYDWIGRKIKNQPTKSLLEKYECPRNIDILSIDVEGYEDKVLKGMDFQQR